jgi:hypothetical protein
MTFLHWQDRIIISLQTFVWSNALSFVDIGWFRGVVGGELFIPLLVLGLGWSKEARAATTSYWF